jgi:hypothetical protein
MVVIAHIIKKRGGYIVSCTQAQFFKKKKSSSLSEEFEKFKV